MDKLKFRKMQLKDALEVVKLESTLIGKTNLETVKATLSSETLSYYVLEENDQIIGFLEASIISPESEIFDIAVKKEFQGKGYGKMLMENFISICKSSGVNTIFLEVNSINKKAISFYLNAGFEPYAERKNYYGKNLDAILMKKQM